MHTPADQAGKVEISRADILSTIDFELEVLRKDHERTGLSPWVLTTALAALAWLALGEFDSPTPPGPLGVGAVLLVVTITDLFAWPFHALAGLSAFPVGAGYLRYGQVTRGMGALCGYLIATRAAMLAGAIWTASHLPWYSVALVGAINLFLVGAIGLFLLLLRAVPADRIVPLQNTTPPRAQFTVAAATYGSIASAAIILGWSLTSHGMTLSELRAGCLIGGAQFLCVLAVSNVRSNHVAKDLLLVRRRLALGQLSPPAALQLLAQELLGVDPNIVPPEQPQPTE